MAAVLITPNNWATSQLSYLAFAPARQHNYGLHGLQELVTCQSDLALIEQGEGFRSCMYHDSVGIKTICYGFNLQKSGASAQVAAVGGNYNSVVGGGCLTQPQCEKLLMTDVQTARSGFNAIYGNSITCQCAKDVLVDMTYNLGQAGLAGFYTFNSMIKSHQWVTAADHLTATLWCSQVKSRCTRNIAQIKQCA